MTSLLLRLIGRRDDHVAAGREDRQSGGDGAADMKQREAIDDHVGFIQSVDLRKAPGGVDLIAVRKPDQLRPARGAPGVKERADGRPVRAGIEAEPVRLAGNRLVEAAKPVVETAVVADDPDLAQGFHAPDHIVGLLPDRGIILLRGYDEDGRALGDQKIGNGIFVQKVVDRACNARNLGTQKRCRNLRKDRAEYRDRSATGLNAVRPEEIGRARYRAQQFTMGEADFALAGDIRGQHGQSRAVRMQPRRRLEQVKQIARGNERIVRQSLQCLDIGNRRNGSGESRRDRRGEPGDHRPFPPVCARGRPALPGRRRTLTHPPVFAREASRAFLFFALDTPADGYPLAPERKRFACLRKD